MDFHAIRKEYEDSGIDISDFGVEPMADFQKWLDVATELAPSELFESNAMALATCGSDGQPSVRWVLLKGMTGTGIKFYTNYDSDKAVDLAENPRASVAFHWPYLGRQVRMEGLVEKTTRQDSEAYFHSRPRGSQMGAAVSPQSSEIENREQLELKREALNAAHPDLIPLPDNWGGYELTLARVEFWQGRRDRLHDRVVFIQENGIWTKRRIAP